MKDDIMSDDSVKIVDKYLDIVTTSYQRDNYKGLAIHTLEGLHEYVAKIISDNFKPGASVLDLGAGSGAMSLRLHDLGFEVAASDFVEEAFIPRGRIPFSFVDLNDTFSHGFNRLFDVVIAIETVEHLENPRRFVRECCKLVKLGGSLVLTTPNVENPVSKALFVRNGTFMWFDDNSYRRDGHITHLTPKVLDKILIESNLSLHSLTTFGDPYKEVKKVWKKLWLLAKCIEKIQQKKDPLPGEILVALTRKN